ncbi:MAG: AsmA family protein [Burkholderiaceae bacterium]|nr:AsmA family protein [Burkholderiaceae bacterium]
MSPLLRKILLVLALLLGLLVAAAVWLIATFDANRYKSLAVDWMQQHRQRQLTLGDVQLSVFPRLQVALRDVTLSEFQQPQQRFASLAEARLAVQWLPLLRQQLVVDEVQARGLSLAWRRDAQGRSNLDDLLRPDADARPPETAEAQPLRFDIRALRLEQVQLDLDDRLAKLKGQATLAELQTGRLTPGEPTAVQLSAQARFSEPAAQLGLQARTQLKLDFGDARQPALKVQAGDLTLQLQGDLPGLRGLDATVQGALAYDAGTPGGAGAASAATQGASAASAAPAAAASPSTASIEAAPLSIALRVQAGALQLQQGTLTLQRFAFRPAQQQLDLARLALQLEGTLASAGGPAQPLKVALDWPQLEVQGRQLKGAPLSGRFSLQGPAALEGTLGSGAPTGSFEVLRVPALQLTLGAATQGAGASRVRGTLRSDLTARLAEQAVTLADLALDATVHNPALQPLKLLARGQVDASPRGARWDLDGQMNAQAFRSDGQLTLGGTRPRLQAQARFGELDLNALLPPRPAAAAGAASAPGSPPAPAPAGPAADTPVDLAGLRALDARVSLQAGTLRYHPYVLKDLVAQAVLEDGRLQIAPLRLRTWDGTLDARLEADAGTGPARQRLALQASAQDILIQALLKDVAGRELLEGRGRLTLDLATGGASVKALERGLNGSAALQLRDGAVQGINLAQRLREVKAALSLKQDAVEAARRSEKTDFSELSASFRVRDGVAENRDLSLKSPFLRLGGEGRVDLPQRRLDYTARSTVAATSKGQGGAELDALRGVTVPVRLSGPLEAPTWRIVWSEVAVGAAGNLVKDQLRDKLEAKAAEKLGLKASDAASAPLKEQLRDAAKDKAREAMQKKLEGLLGR